MTAGGVSITDNLSRPTDTPAPATVAQLEIEGLHREIERLRASGQRDRNLFEAVLRHSPHGVIVCDAAGQLILQNEAAEKIWRGSARAETVAGWGQYKAFHEDGRPYAPEDWSMAECLRSGATTVSKEFNIERFDGSRGWLLGSSAPIRGPNGEIEGALSIFADVTELKEANLRRFALEKELALRNAALSRASRRATAIETIAAALTRALSVHDVGSVVVESVRSLLGADVSVAYLVTEEGLQRIAATGGNQERLRQSVAPLPLATPWPAAHAARTGELVALKTAAEIERRFPDFARARFLDPMHAVVAVPFLSETRVVGVMGFGFSKERALDEEERQFLRQVASQCVPAVERARLFEAEREARRAAESRQAQLELLANVGAIISSSLDFQARLSRLVEVCVPVLADWCAVDVVGSDGALQRLAVFHRDEEKVALAHEIHRRYPVKLDAKHGVPHVLRTGEPEWVREIPDELLVAVAVDEEHLRIVRQLGLKSYLVVPLKGRERVLGALSLVFAESGRLYGADELRIATDVAQRASLAIENARLFSEVRRNAEDLRIYASALETMNNVGALMATELKLSDLVQAITEAATALSGAQFGAFFYSVTDDHGDRYMLYSVAGVARENFSKFPMPRNTAVFAPTFSGEGIVRSDDITKDPRYGHNAPHHGMPKGHLPVKSYLAVPVMSRSGSVIGGLFFGHAEPGRFTDRAEQLVSAVAAQASIAMDNARLFQDAQRLIQALERSNADLDQFAYVTSHDLKAPLRGIASLAEWLEEDLAPVLTDDARKKLALLQSRVRRMESLIQGILAYSRAARVRARPELIDLDRLARESVDMLALKAPARVEITSDLPQVVGEKTALQQVLMNLISNAVKHAARPDVLIRISARDLPDAIELAVSDNGPGIEAEYHQKIFGIFQTLEARDKVESTGIGLAIVKKIVESRGGRAWVESEPGQGATFKFTWPKREERS